MNQKVLILFLVLGFAGCKYSALPGKTKVLEASQDDNLGGTGTDSADIRAMADRMAREIAAIQWPKSGTKPRIAVLPLENQTRFRVDPKLLQNKLLKDLIKFSGGSVSYLARDTEQAVMVERSKKRAGMYDHGKQAATMAGADYLLKGEMRSLSKASREGVSDYILYSFQLVDSETGVILWVGDYETKKAGETGVVYQ